MTFKPKQSSLGLAIELVKRSWFVPVAYLLVNLVVLYAEAGGSRGYEINAGEMLASAYTGSLGIIIALLVSWCSVRYAYGYLFKRNAAQFFGALPVRRTKLYVLTFLAAYVPLLVVVVLATLLSLLLFSGNYGYSIEQALLILLYNSLALLAFCGTAALAVQLNGRPGISFVVYLMLGFYFVIAELAVKTLLDYGVFGFVNAGDMMLWWTSIPEAFALNAFHGLSAIDWRVPWACAAAGLALAAVGALLYRCRHLERAGDAFVHGRVRAIATVLFALEAGLTGGIVLYTMACQAGSKVLLAFLVVVCSIVAYAIAEAVSAKSIRVLRKRIVGLLAVVIISGLACLFCLADITNVGSRVPEADEVESVTIEQLNCRFKDPDAIALACDLHRGIIAAHDAGLIYDVEYVTENRDYQSVLAVGFEYALKDGSTLNRTYYLGIPWGWDNYLFDAYEELDSCPAAAQARLDDITEAFQSADDGEIALEYFELTDQSYRVIKISNDMLPELQAAMTKDILEHGALSVLGDGKGAMQGDITIPRSKPVLFALNSMTTPATVAWLESTYGIDIIEYTDDDIMLLSD